MWNVIKHWKVIATLGILILPALLVNPQWLADKIAPIDFHSIHYEAIQLGELSPAKTHPIQLKLRNTSWRSIRLTSFQSDCGCVVVDSAPKTLAPLATETIDISLKTPAEPGEILRSLVFAAADYPELVWKVNISGQVRADVWASPAVIEAVVSPDETVSRTVSIRHLKNVNLGEIKSSSQTVQIIDSWTVEDGKMIKLAIKLADAKKTTPETNEIQVFTNEAGSPPCLIVPVVCKIRPAITFFPEVLKLDVAALVKNNASPIRRTVIITLPASTSQQLLQVKSLVPWVQAKLEPISASDYEMNLTIYSKQLPNELSIPILSITMAGSPNGSSVTQEFVCANK